MPGTYTFEALEYASDSSIASVCALGGGYVYEDPDHVELPIDEARQVAHELTEECISDAVIEQKWAQIG